MLTRQPGAPAALPSRRGNVRGWRRAAACALGLALSAYPAAGQGIRGMVRDSASTTPISGVVVTLLDPNGAVVARGLTDEHGQFAVASRPSARRLRLTRIGFRAKELPISTSGAGAQPLDVKMSVIPYLLEPVTVRAHTKCGASRDAAQTFALYEQARAALLAAVVARETNAGAMKRLVFERIMDGGGDRVDHQKVRIDSSIDVSRPFAAVRSARDFVAHGFMGDDGAGVQTFFAPDADVLLDDEFAENYCFSLRPGERDRAREVGIAFRPADRRRDQVDVNGVLWVDTLARELRDIEFRYVGLDARRTSVHPGGSVSFATAPNGVVFVDRWNLRMPGVFADTGYEPEGRPIIRYTVFAKESGGEVARAWWHGATWTNSLGALRLRVTRAGGQPANAIRVRLDSTDYEAVPDDGGAVEIPDLLPGPYRISIVDPDVPNTAILMLTSGELIAHRDSIVQRELPLPDAYYFMHRTCRADDPAAQDARISARVVASRHQPVSGVRWVVTAAMEQTLVEQTGLTGSDGLLRLCASLFDAGEIDIAYWREHGAKMILHRRFERRPQGIVDLPAPP